eukprot:COSAG02_NODE_526_length_20707_cov_11.431337_2_plen_64_part_00
MVVTPGQAENTAAVALLFMGAAYAELSTRYGDWPVGSLAGFSVQNECIQSKFLRKAVGHAYQP